MTIVQFWVSRPSVFPSALNHGLVECLLCVLVAFVRNETQ